MMICILPKKKKKKFLTRFVSKIEKNMLNKLRFYDQIRQLIIDDNNEKHRRLYRHEMIILLIEFIRFIGYLFICFKDISLLQTLASYDPTVKLIFGNVIHSNTTLHYHQHKIENCRVTALTLAIGILYIIQSQYVIYFNDYRLIGLTSSKQQFGFSIGHIHIINHKYFFEVNIF